MNINPWNPIETAPKDGTQILLASLGVEDTGYMYHVAHYGCVVHMYDAFRKGCPNHEDCKMGWISGLFQVGGEHTHWTTLPKMKIEIVPNLEGK